MRWLGTCAGLGLVGLLSAGCAALGGGLGAPGGVGPTPAWELPPPPPPEGPITQPGALERFELDSGLHAIALRDKRIPHVVLGVTVRRGAAIEPLEHAGLAGRGREQARQHLEGGGLARAVGAEEAHQ